MTACLTASTATRQGWACGLPRSKRYSWAASSSSVHATITGGRSGSWYRSMTIENGADPGGNKVAVLIVDDHDVVHWGFRLLFSQQPWVTRCLSARSTEEAI